MDKVKTMYYITDWAVEPGNYKYDYHRFPQAYIELMPWYILNWKDVNNVINDANNIIFVNTPVGDELNKLKKIKELIPNNKVIVIQEGCWWDWFEWPAEEQQLYVEILSSCHAFHCNKDIEKDARIFTDRLLFGRICTNQIAESPRGWGGEYVFIANPIKRFQRGMIAHKLVNDSVPTDVPIYSMKYNRPKNFNELLSFPDSYTMERFNLVDSMPLNNWYGMIYNSKFGVDIARDHAGGNIVLEFGSLGVPLIGNVELQPQSDIFPELSFEYHDVDGIKKAIHLLLNDKDFHNEVSLKAYNRVKEHWNSETVVNEFKENLKEFL